jgi:hypothetical protein
MIYMKTIHFYLLGILLFSGATLGQAQGTFQNLDFESANLSPIPAGQYGGEVPISLALPGWTGYLGTTQVTQVLQNDLTLGDASIDIFGPYSPAGAILQGQYTVILQPGVEPGSGPLGPQVSASISQTGSVPADALSLEFEAQIDMPFSISLGAQDLSLSVLGTGPNYTLYGAGIPASDAGQDETLTISALAADNNGGDSFDAFVFSPAAVPEPSPMILAGVGSFLFVLQRRFAVNR